MNPFDDHSPITQSFTACTCSKDCAGHLTFACPAIEIIGVDEEDDR
jgi:hypothetical protein